MQYMLPKYIASFYLINRNYLFEIHKTCQIIRPISIFPQYIIDSLMRKRIGNRIIPSFVKLRDLNDDTKQYQ